MSKIKIGIIGAGGIKSSDINNWLEMGYNSLTIGRELPNQRVDEHLMVYLKSYNENPN